MSSSTKEDPDAPSIGDDLSYQRPLTDHGTAVAYAASDLSYDFSESSSSSSSIALTVKVNAEEGVTTPDGMELICSNDKEGFGHDKKECKKCTNTEDDDSHSDHSHESDNFEHHDEEEPNLEKIASWIQDGTISRILVLSGAGGKK